MRWFLSRCVSSFVDVVSVTQLERWRLAFEIWLANGKEVAYLNFRICAGFLGNALTHWEMGWLIWSFAPYRAVMAHSAMRKKIIWFIGSLEETWWLVGKLAGSLGNFVAHRKIWWFFGIDETTLLRLFGRLIGRSSDSIGRCSELDVRWLIRRGDRFLFVCPNRPRQQLPVRIPASAAGSTV